MTESLAVRIEYEDIPCLASDDDDDDGDDDTGSSSSCALIGQLTEEFWANDRAYFVQWWCLFHIKRGKI